MISRIKNRAISIYYAVISSIAFLPAMIASGMFLLAFLLLSFEDAELTEFLIENASYLVINNSETARAILTTLIGGIISLTVFSFSMVMVILNQASSNFSPRLLPGLISNKQNQIVLGCYIGTILYNIIVLISILPTGDSYTLNGFSILVGIVLGVMCLGMFVYFIHHVSVSIQINHILRSIFLDAKGRLDLLIEKEVRQVSKMPSIDIHQDEVLCKEARYFHGVTVTSLVGFAKDNEANILVAVCKGDYLLPNAVVLKTSIDLDDTQRTFLDNAVLFTGSPDADDNFVLGIKQITEVGVKAMSPGINDPGTAVMTIEYLTELLALRMKMSEYEIHRTDDEKNYVVLSTAKFRDLLWRTLAAYRQYCKHDVLLMKQLIFMLNYLIGQEAYHDEYYKELKCQLLVIKEDIEVSISNSHDKKVLMKMIQE